MRTASKSLSGRTSVRVTWNHVVLGTGERDVAQFRVHHVARAPGEVARLAGGDAVAAPLRLAHHREGGVLVDLEDLERVGDEEDVHCPPLLHKSGEDGARGFFQPCRGRGGPG